MVRVVFIHPDLGIGGAERAMVDAALSLKSQAHSVHFITAHHDPSHCFDETKNGTFPVTVAGDWLPRTVLGRCYALCAYIRMIYAAVYLVFFSGIEYDMIFCDQISACIPVLKMSGRGRKILFYCHFPDLLLTSRQGWLKKMYRKPIDWLEEKTTGMADVVLVNSKFTGGIFKETFKSLCDVKPEVLYPIPDFSSFGKSIEPPTDDLMPSNKIVFLSINRYERKKNLPLAIKALGTLKDLVKPEVFKDIHLIMAGGYDERVTENVDHYLELRRLADKLDLNDCVSFLRSFSDSQKRTLLKYSSCLLYTPDKEHFGIVPVEAMFMKCPVIAVNSGGPLETVADGNTGFLCDANERSFADAMLKIFSDENLREQFGVAGHKRVVEKFSFDAFTKQLHRVVEKLTEGL